MSHRGVKIRARRPFEFPVILEDRSFHYFGFLLHCTYFWVKLETSKDAIALVHPGHYSNIDLEIFRGDVVVSPTCTRRDTVLAYHQQPGAA